MNLFFESNAPEFDSAFADYIRFYGVDVPRALRFQSRLLAQEFIRRTPSDTRAQGRKAVERDITRAVRPLRPQDFKSAKIRALIRKRDYEGLQTVFSRFPTDSDLRGVSVRPFAPELHERVRDRRGRVTRFKRQATPDADKLSEYITRMKGHVGQAKGGWAASLIALGGSPSAWIAEHARSGRFEDHAGNPVSSYIQMTNQSQWSGGGDEDRVIANALRTRSVALLNDLAYAQARALERSFKR